MWPLLGVSEGGREGRKGGEGRKRRRKEGGEEKEGEEGRKGEEDYDTSYTLYGFHMLVSYVSVTLCGGMLRSSN